MLLRTLLILLLGSIPVTAISAEHDNGTCENIIDNTFIDIYSRSIRQVFELMVASKKIEKDDVEIYPIEPDRIISVLNSGFDTNIFSKACFSTAKMYTFRYNTPSYVRFGLCQLTFNNKKDIEYAQKILDDEKTGFLPKTELVISFTWHRLENSIFIIMETNLTGHRRLDQLEEK
jgi:hypothetical protein